MRSVFLQTLDQYLKTLLIALEFTISQQNQAMGLIFLNRFLPLFFLFISRVCVGQPDHLQPVNSIFDNYEYELTYHLKLRTLLIDSVSGITEIQFVDVPSFTPERVLLIKRVGDNYKVILRRPSRSIWFSQFESEKPEIEIINIEKEIDLEMVEILKGLYESVLRNLKVHNDESWTPDVRDFYFSANLLGLRTGTTVSPKSGSKMEELVHINEEIIRLVEKTKGSEIIFSKELIDRIRSLENKIEN